MSATEELRRMLNERGVEYEGGERSLRWRDRYGIMMQAFPLANGELGMAVWSCTPEQAIAATLGTGTCKADETDTWECVRDDLGGYGKTMTVHVMECTECGGTYEHINGGYEFCPNCGRKVVDT